MKKISKIIPIYAIIPFLIALGCQFISFYFTRVINVNFVHHTIRVPLFDDVPVVPFFILFYFTAYIQWVIGYIFTARESREVCYRFYAADVISKLLSGIIFIVFPTIMERQEIKGNGFFEFLMRFIYFVDSPDNLFPSLHCLVSWLCVRQSFKIKKLGKWYRAVQIIITLFVFASVLFVKQHLFIDILGGILIAEIGIFISDKAKVFRIFDLLNKKIWRGKDLTEEEKAENAKKNIREEYQVDRSI